MAKFDEKCEIAQCHSAEKSGKSPQTVQYTKSIKKLITLPRLACTWWTTGAPRIVNALDQSDYSNFVFCCTFVFECKLRTGTAQPKCMQRRQIRLPAPLRLWIPCLILRASMSPNFCSGGECENAHPQSRPNPNPKPALYLYEYSV